MKISNKFLRILYIILVIMFILLFFLILIIIFCIIYHLISNGYVDWNHFIFELKKHNNRIVSINEFINSYFVLFIPLSPLLIIFSILYATNPDKYLQQYYDNFLHKFSDFGSVPTKDIIKYMFNKKMYIMTDKILESRLGIKVLVPFIKQKIKYIKNIDILKKYSLFYTNNISGINIGTLSIYHVSPNDINELIKKVIFPEYISFNLVSSKEEQDNILNGDKYKNKDDLVLQIVFNQKEILKQIVLEVFLNESTTNNIIKNDILKQIKYYYKNKSISTDNIIIEQISNYDNKSYNNINNKNMINNNNLVTDTSNDKVQILIDVVKENINENKEFKEKFFKVLNTNE